MVHTHLVCLWLPPPLLMFLPLLSLCHPEHSHSIGVAAGGVLSLMVQTVRSPGSGRAFCTLTVTPTGCSHDLAVLWLVWMVVGWWWQQPEANWGLGKGDVCACGYVHVCTSDCRCHCLYSPSLHTAWSYTTGVQGRSSISSPWSPCCPMQGIPHWWCCGM